MFYLTSILILFKELNKSRIKDFFLQLPKRPKPAVVICLLANFKRFLACSQFSRLDFKLFCNIPIL